MDDEARRQIVEFGQAMENIMVWVLRLCADHEPQAVDLEMTAWLDVDRPRRAQAMAGGGCTLLSVLIVSKARMQGLLPPGKAISQIELEFPDGAETQPGYVAVAQVTAAIARGDHGMAEDLLQGHLRAGGTEAVVDIGFSTVEIISSLLMSYPDLLPGIRRDFHDRN